MKNYAFSRLGLKGAVFLISIFGFGTNFARSNETTPFLETFALAEDRGEALKELIPGTEDYYYYSALLAQQEQRLDDVRDLLEPWMKRHGETPRYREIENRQALLGYTDAPDITLDYLKRRLGLKFNHQQQRLDQKPDFPTEMNPDLITWDAYLEQVRRRHKNLKGVLDEGLDRIIRTEQDLSDTERTSLLRRLKYPDYDRVVGLIAADLRSQSPLAFGSIPIHGNLTIDQLKELLGLRPQLANDPSFVDIWLAKLRPGEDESVELNLATRVAYIDRLWSYVESLDPVFNSLKANVLYQKLDLARHRGEYPRELFMVYLALPRILNYVEPKYLQRREVKAFPVNLNENYSEQIGSGPIRSDEELVREYLEQFLKEDENYNRFSAFIKEPYLKRVFAETKLLHGVGEAEKWFSMLSPGEVQSVQDRIEISFARVNAMDFAVEDDVSLALDLKHVDELIVKVYEINSLNFYLDQEREINTDLKLDGLIANEEKIYRYEEAPILRHRESFTFNSLKDRRGVWVLEFIGNGISSRALVRKGKLQYASEPTPGGKLVTILNEKNELIADASIWFGGNQYEANDAGKVLLPFSTAGRASVVLSDGVMSSLTEIDLLREEYQFTMGGLLERESLLPGSEAELSLRPVLSLNGAPMPASLLENVRLTVTTLDHDGVDSKSEVSDFDLFDDRESIHRFRIPNRLASVSVELRGEIPPVSYSGAPIEVSSFKTIDVNGVDQSPSVADAYLSRFGESYVLEVLGKSGEGLPDTAVNLQFNHRDFEQPILVSLKTGQAGRINLGRLDEIIRVTVDGGGLMTRSWPLRKDSQRIGPVVHAVAGEAITIPAPQVGAELQRSDLAIFEVRKGVIVRDVFNHVKYEKRALKIADLEPGDYRALLRSGGETFQIRVTAADARESGYALSQSRHLKLNHEAPLFIASAGVNGENVEIGLEGVSAMTRVHVVATRFLPEVSLLDEIGRGHRIDPIIISRGTNESRYVSGRDIGEEYRYILERRSAKKFPGNLMTRPGLLLNPFELNDTDTEIKDAEGGEDYDRSEEMTTDKRRGGAPVASADSSQVMAPKLSRSLDFLRHQAVVISNLQVGEDGLVVINKEDLGDRQHIHVVAVDAFHSAYAQLFLPEVEGGTEFRDLRLRNPLDLDKSFTQRRNVTLLEEGETLTIGDLRSAEMQTYDTIGQVYDALVAINPDQALRDARLLMQWPSLDEEIKGRQLSELASHELHFFLAQKDPEYFEGVVKPYLANKKDKTFMDHYLLGDDLSRFLAPWEFSRLNIVERILMSRRLGDDARQRTSDHVTNLRDLMPPDPLGRAQVFRQALRGLSADRSSYMSVNLGGAVDNFADASEAANPFGAQAAPATASARPSMRVKPVPRGVNLAFEKERAANEGNAAMNDQAYAKSTLAVTSLNFGAEIPDLREQGRRQVLFEKLETTKEWAENNYWMLPIEQQNADLVQVNAFWKDFAAWDGKGGFYSREFPVATSNYTEMMFVLSVLDLPFESEKHEVTVEDSVLKLTSASPVVIFHEEIQETKVSEEDTPILVSQNFFRSDDRFRYVDGQQLDKFVTREFLTGVVYGGQVVVTNPTSSAHLLDLLVQVPKGAIPVGGSDYTRSYPLSLGPFSTERHEVFFYFPKNSGEESFDVYPVQVAKNEEIIASGEPAQFKVVNQLTQFDEASWDYLSQFGTEKEVLDYLASENLYRLDLGRIAWRARESVDFFKQATQIISERHAYNEVLWSYGIYHNLLAEAREYLKHRDGFLRQCGGWIETELVSLNSVERHWYQHLEYSPMVNARAHQLGRERRILNDRFRGQYHAFLKNMTYLPELPSEDRLTISGYLFLQDRIEEGLIWLSSVEPDEIKERLQYDYLVAYASFFEEKPGVARRISNRYVDHPLEHWRIRFQEIANRLNVAEEAANENEETRDQKMDRLSSSDSFFELTSEGREAKIEFTNLPEVTVNFYEMDLEFLFSSQPFVSGGDGQFSYIKPNASLTMELVEESGSVKLEMPEAFAKKNVLVEVLGDGKTRSVAIYANALKVQFSERYGRLSVIQEGNGKPVSKTYVKVYARMKDGAVRFFKDGYTDFRGEFDYVSLNTNELDQVDELSLLVMSDEHGSLVREVYPPQR
jgi:hypothetical protein